MTEIFKIVVVAFVSILAASGVALMLISSVPEIAENGMFWSVMFVLASPFFGVALYHDNKTKV